MTPQHLQRLALRLGAVSSIGIVLSWLALQDIFHGYETDLSTEWWVVRVALLLSVAFHVASLTALRGLRKP